MDIHVYRDQPKRGETDAKWCGYLSMDGHVIEHTTGHETEEEAREHLANRRSDLETHLALKGAGLL